MLDAGMTSDRDIFTTAKLLIQQHGDTAWFEAAQRADTMLDKGDIEGAATWKRVLAAIRKLQDAEPGEIIH